MRAYPALELTWPVQPTDEQIDLALAAIDDCGPIAVDHTASGVRVFFASPHEQQAAQSALHAALPDVEAHPLLVDDEDWAERSQAALTPIQVGRVIVAPPWHAITPPNASAVVIVIVPSMGFGTGHHPSTRLCLLLMQQHLVPGCSVLDVGTGSGVLAIAAGALGANRVVGVDTDADALANAAENVELNHANRVELRVADINGPAADLAGQFTLVLANLTGALLARSAGALLATLQPGGLLIASGYQPDERGIVTDAFRTAGATPVDEATESDWVGGVFRR